MTKNYWLLQLNGKTLDDIRNSDEIECRVTRYADRMKKGDKVLVWLSKENAGIAIAEIIDPAPTVSKNPDSSYCKIGFTSKLLEKPLQLKQKYLERDSLLKNLVISDPNCNTSQIDDSQWKRIQRLIGKIKKVADTKKHNKKFREESPVREGYKKIFRLLNDRKNWKSLAIKNWTGTDGEKISEFQQILIVDFLYQLWLLQLSINNQNNDEQNKKNNLLNHTWIVITLIKNMLGEEHFELSEIALEDWGNVTDKELEITKENIRLVRSCVEKGEKDPLAAVNDFIFDKNPVLWLYHRKGSIPSELFYFFVLIVKSGLCSLMRYLMEYALPPRTKKAEYVIIQGRCFEKFSNFCHLMTFSRQESIPAVEGRRNRYKAPEIEPECKKRKRGGNRAGNFSYTYYGELELHDSPNNKVPIIWLLLQKINCMGGILFLRELLPNTEEVFKILERRHLWLDKCAYKTADELTEEFKENKLTKLESLKYNNLVMGGLKPEKREKYQKYLSRKSILEKLKDYKSDRLYPLYNCFYSQKSGRIEAQWLHPAHISEKIGKSDKYPGGVRQAIFCATKNGRKLSASDCCASAWQLASLFLSDEETQQIACGKEKDFNTEMTEEALKGDYFDQDKLTEKGGDDEGKRGVARELVKKLLLTTLYGSTTSKHLEWADNNGYGDIWKPANSKKKNGASRFMSHCKKKFRVLREYVSLMKKVAQVACEKYPKGFKMPYIFEENAWLNFDYPKMSKSGDKSKRVRLQLNSYRTEFYLKLPESPFQLDEKQIKRSLPPLLIHSIDSTVIKHLILLLDEEISKKEKSSQEEEKYGFATIHDCVFFPKDVITFERIQKLWKEALMLTYKSFEPLYKWIIDILKTNNHTPRTHLDRAEKAYQDWQSNVENPDFLDKLWMSTDKEY